MTKTIINLMNIASDLQFVCFGNMLSELSSSFAECRDTHELSLHNIKITSERIRWFKMHDIEMYVRTIV